MKLFPRIIASGVALAFVAGACGAGTGEAPPVTAPTAAPVAAATPAATAAKPTNLVVIGDLVRGQAQLTDAEKKLDDNPAGLHCVVMSRFPQGSRIVWRIKVLDPLSLRSLDDQALEYVRLTLPDGKSQDLKFGGHGGTKENPADKFWATGYTVPDEYPTGVFNWKVDAKSKEGALGTFGFDAFKVGAAQTMIVPKGLTRRV